MAKEKVPMQKVPLSYPLPPTERVELPGGKWHCREWTPATRKLAEAERYKMVPAIVDEAL